MKNLVRKMAKKLKTSNGSTREMTEEEIQNLKDEVKGDTEE